MTGSGFDCQDVDECNKNSTLPHNCSLLAMCNNTEASYFCKCMEGYQGDGFTCDDVDECLSPSICENMTCQNVPGTYTCTCTLGLVYGFGTCVNESDCKNVTNACNTQAECKNIRGSNYCSCIEGFLGNGRDCQDVDECAQTGACPELSHCFNTEGSFHCDCWEGYQYNGTHCEDISECSVGTFTCPDNSSCHNKREGIIVHVIVVSFTITTLCVWMLMNVPQAKHSAQMPPIAKTQQDGISVNAGMGMQAIRQCVRMLMNAWTILHVQTTVSVSTLKVHFCVFVIMDFPLMVPEVPQCEDIDECSNPEFGPLCTNGTCINTIGSFYCACEKGFWSNDTRCLDIDECEKNESICQPNSTCVNIPGSYECNCNLGYVLNRTECRDIDECLANNSPCTANAICLNTAGSFQCPCTSGFEAQGRRCTDINECL